ncbi:MAG: hypothetical protein E7062_01055 [Spirochaetaceae bacterium]|nr:hypothetical protein [Spirochaetaceae bacterium]
MKKIKKALSFILCLFFSGIIFAQSEKITNVFSSEVVEELYREKKLTNIIFDQESIEYKYLPKTSTIIQEDFIWKNTEKPVCVIEKLYFFPKTDVQKGKDDSLVIKEVISKIEKLEGVEYYSNTRKKWRVLYDKFYVIDPSDTKTKIESPSSENLDGKVIHILQRDASFGEYVTEITYSLAQNNYAFYVENESTLKMLGVPGVKPGNLTISVVISSFEDCITVYIVAEMLTPKVPFLKQNLEKSFGARADAIASWFYKNYSEKF